MKKQSIDKCLAEYSDKDLIQFHANIQALVLCCTQQYAGLFSLMFQIFFEISMRQETGSKLCAKYIKATEKLLS